MYELSQVENLAAPTYSLGSRFIAYFYLTFVGFD